MNDILFFDIETEKHPDAARWIEPPRAPSNWKDPNKIDAYVKEKLDEKLERAALDPDLGRIVAIGMQSGIKGTLNTIIRPVNEAHILQPFWEAVQAHEGRVCGWNILHFDIPYLLRRSFALGVMPKFNLDLRRYRTEPVTDLYAIWHNWEIGTGMKWIAKRYGFATEGLEDIDGSMVTSMTDDDLNQYVRSDIATIVRLYKRMRGVYWPYEEELPF